MLYSVGHSNHEQDQFCDLLRKYEIQVLVDVRTQPYSRYTSQFNREELKAALTACKIRYLFMGEQLGGRPEGEQYYDVEGKVLYHAIADADFFRAGVDRLRKGGQQYRVAMMCSEEDPVVCHRYLLISRVLTELGEQVWHIRGDGSVETEAQVRAANGDETKQGLLFPELEEDSWKSIRSVLPKVRPPISSDD